MLSRTPIRGSTGPAPTTVWMSALADQYTILSPYRDDATALSFSTPVNASANSVSACNYTSQFNYYNSTLGGSTTSPDGANDTARKILEDSSSSEHYIQAGAYICRGGWPIFRVAGIFKAAERTRIAFQCWSHANFPGTTPRMTCGFDLAGGQIAYGATFQGPVSPPPTSYFTLRGQQISPVGNGFYLCIADVQPIFPLQSDGFNDGLSFRFILDNGSGTAAMSTSYAGVTTSGLYGWRHSVLPLQAWKVNSVCFFDDFNDPTMANIDLHDTKVPGFDWYTSLEFSSPIDGSGWMSHAPPPLPPNPAALSVSNSILRIPYQPNTANPHIGAGGISTWSYSNGVERGQGWRGPVVFETRLAYDYPNADHVGNFSWWFGGCEFAIRTADLIPGTDNSVGYFEFDPCETGAGRFAMGPSLGGFMLAAQHGVIGVGPPFPPTPAVPWAWIFGTSNIQHYHGWPPWQQAWALSGAAYTGSFATVEHNNHYYYMSAFTAAEPPGGNWVEFFYPTNVGGPTQPVDPLIKLDFTQQHTYTFMVFPYDPRDPLDRGCTLIFFDGVFRWMMSSWGPTVNPVGEFGQCIQQAIADPQRIFAMFNYNQATDGTSGYDAFIDYFKVLQ